MMIIKSVYIVAFLLEKNPLNANDKICDMFEQVLLHKIITSVLLRELLILKKNLLCQL